MKKRILASLIIGLGVTFSNASNAAGFTISSCSLSSLTDGGGNADSCSFGPQKTGQQSGVGNGDLYQSTLDGIDGGGWDANKVIKSDQSGSGLTISPNGATSGTWNMTNFNLTQYFQNLGGFNPNNLVEALFVIKASTAFEWFLFKPLAATIVNGTPTYLTASGTWTTADYYKTSPTDGQDPNISHMDVYFRKGTVPSVNPVPVPAAVWLFGSGLSMMFGFARRRAK